MRMIFYGAYVDYLLWKATRHSKWIIVNGIVNERENHIGFLKNAFFRYFFIVEMFPGRVCNAKFEATFSINSFALSTNPLASAKNRYALAQVSTLRC